MVAVALAQRPWAVLADLVAVTKPGLTGLVVATTATGIWLAPGPHALRALVVLAATCLLVGAANAFNEVLERRSDGEMLRTAQRPLPAGRLRAAPVLGLALGAALLGVPALMWAANHLTAVLGAVAYVVYVAVYTPLKRYSSWALPVGAIPGAIPPALGWASVTGRLDGAALALFALLYLWQLAHFLAISIYLKPDYARGRLKVFALVHGDPAAVIAIVASLVPLVPASLALAPLGVVSWPAGALAGALSAAFLAAGCSGFAADNRLRWARRVFLASLAYLPLVLLTLSVGKR